MVSVGLRSRVEALFLVMPSMLSLAQAMTEKHEKAERMQAMRETTRSEIFASRLTLNCHLQ
ncbi:hypothetical protein CWG72_20690 [Salmonella enterica subsp. enterica serovar Carmel]|uniref:Uncharacterized protein n=1 Tax=Salmonella enterica TaxID=28901 RepID=A0A742XW99_SALER|nr:hypothetical protein [Salmonella enterica subsp. enterica serovar Carmel]EBW4675920.1 hypothetical protein [Salmonella enterica subsp. salamae serovar Sofia]EDP8967060.1 hypothetical protein [Salmonella enterica subsp. enterica]EED7473266.1 hypothetical protein [Salmonella enterica subsp. salamae]HAF1734843.1 hypothetical protein [Salmonella enterica]